ncbi:MAG: CDF family Co(II)/Ni(II) efflux transporter DmeF [Pseudohongiellaceae bacterium]
MQENRLERWRHSHSFGTGKVNTLGGYTGAILLAVFAAIMAFESVIRLIEPVTIAFNQAMTVAVVGLVVNGVSVFILGDEHSHEHHQHDEHHHHHHDHNLKSAYLHVLADALTSLLAIFALLIGKYFGAIWMDPLMGIVGAILVARWSLGLLKSTTGILLDEQADDSIIMAMHSSIERDSDCRIVDLHVWIVAPEIHSAIVSIVSPSPREPTYYRAKLQAELRLDHLTIEIHKDGYFN